MSEWYKKSYRRNLVDMHIEDWNDEFMSKFSPEAYVENMKKAQVQSCMIYANSHVGHCYWPTKIGRVHGNMPEGRDWFGEIVNLAHKSGMDAIAYYTVYFVNDEYEMHPEWRMRDANGKSSREEGCVSVMGPRYGLVCPNNEEYRKYVDKHVAELIESYKLEGLFYDMNFWPMVCYCDSCRKRYKKETGKEIPTVVDYNDPEWLEFQVKREAWLVDVAEYLWKTIKSRKPEMTIEHNFALAATNRSMSWTDDLTNWVDFNSGDFYGGMDAQNFINKMHNSITKNTPHEFMTSRCYPGLMEDHTSIKPKDMLRLESAMSLANGGAFFFIDAINPDGSMCSEPYEIIGEVFENTKRYESYLGGRLSADVAVYYSTSSNFLKQMPPYSTKENFDATSHMAAAGWMSEHLAGAVSATRMLKENHIPYTVITKKILKKLDQFSVIVVPNISLMDEDEVAEIKKWVKEGGRLYITCSTPIAMVEEMLGIEFGKMTDSSVTYIYESEANVSILDGVLNRTSPVAIQRAQREVKTNGNAEILAYIGLPYTTPHDFKFASIHSNPPAAVTDIPAILMGNYGKGKVLWSSVSFESAAPQYVSQNKIFANAIRKLIDRPYLFKSSDAPCVDITLIDQKEHSRYLVSFVNLQNSIPLIPVCDFKAAINTQGREIAKVCLLPDEKELNFTVTDGYVDIKIDKLNVFEAVLIYYK